MSTPEGSTTNAAEQQDGKQLPAKTNVLNWGLGREFNITLIAALLSLVVALVTSMITSRIAAENTLRELQRDQERTAITRLEIAQLREIDATIAVVAGGLPAKFTVQGATLDNLDSTSDRVIQYLSAQRECDAARDAVEDTGIKTASKRVSDLSTRIAHAGSLEEAQRYDPDLREARQSHHPHARGLTKNRELNTPVPRSSTTKEQSAGRYGRPDAARRPTPP